MPGIKIIRVKRKRERCAIAPFSRTGISITLYKCNCTEFSCCSSRSFCSFWLKVIVALLRFFAFFSSIAIVFI